LPDSILLEVPPLMKSHYVSAIVSMFMGIGVLLAPTPTERDLSANRRES